MPTTIETKEYESLDEAQAALLVTAPAEAFIFHVGGDAELAAPQADKEGKQIKLTLYDGSIFKHWYWGNMAFELSSMMMAKKKNPILMDHDTDLRLGYSTKAEFKDEFTLEGNLLENETAGKFLADERSGFPFEASLRFDRHRTRLQMVEEGAEAEVNGKTLKGPGVVMRNAVILEGSVTVFGAAANTVTETFSELLKRSFPMAKEDKKTEKTTETPASEALTESKTEGTANEGGTSVAVQAMFTEGDLTVAQQIYLGQGFQKGSVEGFAKGVAAERRRIAEIQRLSPPGQEKLARKLIEDGAELEEAKTQLLQAVQSEQRQNLDSLADGSPPATTTNVEEFTDTAGGKDTPAGEAELRQEFAQAKDRDSFLKMADGDNEKAFVSFKHFKLAEAKGLVRS